MSKAKIKKAGIQMIDLAEKLGLTDEEIEETVKLLHETVKEAKKKEKKG